MDNEQACEINEKQLKAFLQELTALCRKHEMVIDACGCCSSPWVRAEIVGPEMHYVATPTNDADFVVALELVASGSELPEEV